MNSTGTGPMLGPENPNAAAAASARWSDGNADGMRAHPVGNADGMPRRDETSKDETRASKDETSNGSNPVDEQRRKGTFPPIGVARPER